MVKPVRFEAYLSAAEARRRQKPARL